MSRFSSSNFLRSLTSRISASTRTVPSAAGSSARAVSSTHTAAPSAQQVIADRGVGGQALEQRRARLGIDEAIAVERADLAFGRLAGEAEDQFEVGVRDDGRGGIGADRPDVDAFVHGFEQPCECCGALFHRPYLTRVMADVFMADRLTLLPLAICHE